MSQKQSFVENVKRRTFDTSTSEQNILNRNKKNNTSTSTTLTLHTPLQSRTADVSLDILNRVGKTVTITANTDIKNRGGFYCELCNVELKDSNSYLDHINGKKHQSLLGMSMKAERATLTQVQEKFELLKRKDEQKEESKLDIDVILENDEDSDNDEPKKKKSKKKKNKQQGIMLLLKYLFM